MGISRLGLAGLMLTLLALLLSVSALAQQQVAEGEYEMHDVSEAGVPTAKTVIRWTLTRDNSAGYHLESQVLNLPDGIRVNQIEELDDALTPRSIGYDYYAKDENKPSIVLRCPFEGGSITCGGRIQDKLIPNSKPYGRHGPFILWVADLSALDMQWLLSGAVKMIRTGEKDSSVTFLTVYGGTAETLSTAVSMAYLESVKGARTSVNVYSGGARSEWELVAREEETLRFVGTETVELGGTRVAARRYSIEGGEGNPQSLWIAGSGIPIKFDEFTLTNYKQYVRLIPEIKVDDQPSR